MVKPRAKSMKFSHLLCLLVTLLCPSTIKFTEGQKLLGEHQDTCSTDDLNRSELVECGQVHCKQPEQTWPRSEEEVIHYYSTRDDGSRFSVVKLKNLNYLQSDVEKSFDINSTLYVDSKNELQTILGFGTTFDLGELVPSIEEGIFDSQIKPILQDLLASKFSIIRLNITGNALLNGNKVFRIIQELDLIATDYSDSTSPKIKLLLSLQNIVNNHESREALNTLSASLWKAQHLEVWALTLDEDLNDKSLGTAVQNLFKRDIWGLLRQQEAGQYASYTSKESVPLLSLLLKAKFSLPYNIIDHLRANKNLANLITIGSDQPPVREFGDWQVGQNYALEILNHLKHGSNGFIEEKSFVNLLSSPSPPAACSIYQSWPNRKGHFRSPMFYAIGHFSQFIEPQSKLLASNIFTQPNMFAAHYLAAKTRNGYNVVIVLNDNEHPLPFRIALDGRIVLNTLVQQKSFNTFLIK